MNILIWQELAKTDKEILDKLVSLESLLEAGLSEIHKARALVQGRVSTRPAKQGPAVDGAAIIDAAKAAVTKRNAAIKKKSGGG